MAQPFFVASPFDAVIASLPIDPQACFSKLEHDKNNRVGRRD